MSDRQITLTDVMLGVYNLGLCSKIPSAQFRFLIGLILKGNSLGFKKIMEITNGEAMAIGGGNSRQSVNRLRQGLCEFIIDEKSILDVVHGEHFKNISAKYKVNYVLLAGNGSVWRKGEPSPSQNYDGSSDGYDDGNEKERHRKVTDVVTTPRSDQKREEETTTTEEVVAALPSADEQIQETKSDRLVVQGAVLNRYRSQILDRLPSDPATTTLLELYPVHQILEALERMPLVLTPKDNRAVTGNYALGMVEKWIKNPSWGVPDGGNGGATGSIGDIRRAKEAANLALMKEELVELEAKTDGDWSEHILAMQVAIAEAEVG